MSGVEAVLEAARIIPTAEPQGINCNLLIGGVDEPGRVWWRNREGFLCTCSTSFYLL